MWKSSMKNKWLTTQRSTLQQQVQIPIPNLDGRMTLLKIYLKLSVILRQWWISRIKDFNADKSRQNNISFLLKFSDIPRQTIVTKTLRIHWRLIFGNIIRCSAPCMLWVRYFIYFKFTPVFFKWMFLMDVL